MLHPLLFIWPGLLQLPIVLLSEIPPAISTQQPLPLHFRKTPNAVRFLAATRVTREGKGMIGKGCFL